MQQRETESLHDFSVMIMTVNPVNPYIAETAFCKMFFLAMLMVENLIEEEYRTNFYMVGIFNFSSVSSISVSHLKSFL